MSNNEQVKVLKMSDLFSNNTKDKYIIPIYQRNYEWKQPQIAQLIKDIEDARTRTGGESKNYYIGSLVVAKRKDGSFEVIDGQQRLTTLTILKRYLENISNIQNSDVNLSFEHRASAENALNNDKEPKDPAILGGFKDVENALTKEIQDIGSFKNYLYENVFILRTIVPEHTDLNHYFEIMNTRGEQLEKHEIVKARLMQVLPEEEQKTFAVIWDACSDMSRFAISGFKGGELREKLFGSELNYIPTFDEIAKAYLDNNESSQSKKENNTDKLKEEKNTIENILLRNSAESEKDNNEDEGKLASIIDFPNFLMHVLRIYKDGKKEDYPLDEKFLLSSFDTLLLGNNDEEKRKIVSDFMDTLIKCRFLFDYYILKSDYRKEEDGRWVILKPAHSDKKTIYGKNTFGSDDSDRKLILLQSMFHVSFTARNYKDWLFESLEWLVTNANDISSSHFENDFIKKLEEIALKYYENRSKNSELTYTKINHYVLNYLDYKILSVYEKYKTNESGRYIFPDKDKRDENYEQFLKALNEFQFFNRSSVEHYYPQKAVNPWDDPILHNLGNLCLIGHSNNSLLSNREPSEKRNRVLERLKMKTAESAKQLVMMMYKDWTKENAKDHYDKMMALLENQLEKQ